MYDEINAQLAEAQELLARKAQFTVALPKSRECLAQERYQLGQLEAALEHVKGEIDALESLTVQCLWDSITGRKRGKLDRLREESEALRAKCDEAVTTVESVEQAINSLESQLAELGDPEARLRALLDRKQELMLSGNDETAAGLRDTANKLDAVRTSRQKLKRAMQSGKHALERLHSRTSAIGRANTKDIGTRSAGVLGAALVNKALRAGAQPAIRRAEEGLSRFADDLANVDLDGSSELDAEITRLTGALAEAEATMISSMPALGHAEMGMTLPLMEIIQSLLGHLDAQLDQANATVRDLEQARRTLLEQA